MMEPFCRHMASLTGISRNFVFVGTHVAGMAESVVVADQMPPFCLPATRPPVAADVTASASSRRLGEGREGGARRCSSEKVEGAEQKT